MEDRYREILRDNRARDAAAGRTLDGPHLTDLQVIYAPKNMPARDASTGEQKALLIGLVLAHANLVAEMTGITPLLLLDEVVAHLDPSRRHALFDELAKLGAQVWMTGADPAAFTGIGASSRDFRRRFRPDRAARLSALRICAWKIPVRRAKIEPRITLSERSESAFRRLEKPLKNPIYSIAC